MLHPFLIDPRQLSRCVVLEQAGITAHHTLEVVLRRHCIFKPADLFPVPEWRQVRDGVPNRNEGSQTGSMSRTRKDDRQIGAGRDEENAPALLRNPILLCLQNVPFDSVAEPTHFINYLSDNPAVCNGG